MRKKEKRILGTQKQNENLRRSIESGLRAQGRDREERSKATKTAEESSSKSEGAV